MKLITINKDAVKDVSTMYEFYFAIGMEEHFKNGIKDVKQIHANKFTCEWVHNLLKENSKHTKNKHLKLYRKEYRLQLIAWDWLCYAPETDEKLEDYQIGLVYDNKNQA